jgi:nucleoside-diphosphate-sugar epimerase
MSGNPGKKILVTGAGGFIGYHLANYLADLHHEVTGVDLHFPESPFDGKPARFKPVQTDFRDWEGMKKMLEGVNFVFHLASAHLQVSLAESEYWDINVHSLPSLLALCKNCGVDKFIHVSSVGVYGNLRSWPADEESECFPQSIYGETKIAGEREVTKFSKDQDLPVIIIRPAWVYGPGCPRTLKIYRTLKTKRFIMIGNGENLRHPVYIKDMLEAFRLAMEKKDLNGEVILIGGDHAITTNELVNGFSEALDTPKPVLTIPYPLGRILAISAEKIFGFIGKEPPISRRSLEFFDTNNSFDISKAKERLGFNPKFDFLEGLRDTRVWLERQTDNSSNS